MNGLTTWNPFRALERLEEPGPFGRFAPLREMERAMERMQSQMERLQGGLPTWQGGKQEPITLTQWAPPVDIIEDEKEYLVKAELPDVKKDEIKVTTHDGTLSISGERKLEKEEKGKTYHRIERAYGAFERSFSIPEDADASKITSQFKDGILMVHVPKNPAAKPKSIEVKVQ